MKKLYVSFALILAAAGIFYQPASSFAVSSNVASVIDTTGRAEGLAVCIGWKTPVQLADLRRQGFGLVHGLSTDPDDIEKASDYLVSEGVYGQVCVSVFDGEHLPYVDSLVNLLLVMESGTEIQAAEAARVLAPGGVVLTEENLPDAPGGLLVEPIKDVFGWLKYTRPWPSTIDEWTHYLHGPDNNAVAADSEVGIPRTLRWDCGPKYCRSHEMDVSVAAVVTAEGRLFAIVDEGPCGLIGKNVPDQWFLTARDAFSGVLLWKRSMAGWNWREWKPELKELEKWSSLIAHRRLLPPSLPRRLVAVGDTVYVTLGFNAPVTALDAASGRTLREYEQTRGTYEILMDKGLLFLVVRPGIRETAFSDPSLSVKRRISRKPMSVREEGGVMCVDVTTGAVRWKTDEGTVMPLSIAAGAGRVLFHTGSELVCLEQKTGREIWRRPGETVLADRWNARNTLLLYRDLVIFSSPKKCEGFRASDGKLLWSGKSGRGTAFNCNPIDTFLIDDLLWFTSGRAKPFTGFDPYTGELKREITVPSFFHTPGHHLRCYRAKATDRYILDNKRGIEFLDLKGDNHLKHDWVRGVCRYGILPANGLIYSTPTPCSCYQTVLLRGFNALSSEVPPEPSDPKLVKGPAYSMPPREKAGAEDWPTLRYNAAREGAVPGGPGSGVERRWSRKLGGRLTQPVAVNGRVYVCSRDNQVLHALDASDGEEIWQRALPAEVDSPPAYWRGRLLFGCADGWLYNVKSDDGSLIWSFRAAPVERRIVSYNRLESSWPLHGNALILEEEGRAVVYVASGRNSYIDGGIYLYGLDVETGRILCSRRLRNSPQDSTKKYEPHEMFGARSDVMVYDGRYISMQSKVFDRNLNRVEKSDSAHILATGGFLDGQSWHRNFWQYSSGWTRMNKNASTFPNVGQLLVHDGSRTYGVKYFLTKQGQSMVFYPEERGYYLFCDRDDDRYDILLGSGGGGKRANRRMNKKWEQEDSRIWSAWIPVRVRAMVKAGDTLFVAGPPDLIPEDVPVAAFDGSSHAELRAFDAADGRQLAEYRLNSTPVFDGMISARKKLFLSLHDGSVECWGR